MKTLDQAIADKKEMSDRILKAVQAFEEVYGDDVVLSIRVRRRNGSTSTWGKASSIDVEVCLV